MIRANRYPTANTAVLTDAVQNVRLSWDQCHSYINDHTTET